jgi:hypothetical protein
VLPQSRGAADLVLPSKLGGMLASGKPVLATANAGTELFEVLSSTAILVPAGDSVAIAEGKHPALGDGQLNPSTGKPASRNFVRFSRGAAIKARVSAPGPPEPPLSQSPPVPCPSRANIPQPVPSNRAHWHPRRQAAHPTTLEYRNAVENSCGNAPRVKEPLPSKFHLLFIGAQTASHQLRCSRTHAHDIMPG